MNFNSLFTVTNPFGNSGLTPLSPLAAGDPLVSLENIISTIIALMTTVAGIFFIIYFLQGGFQWVTSGGDKTKLEAARGKMINGVIGMIVIIASYSIIGLIGSVLGIPLLRPGQQLQNLVP